MNVLKFKDNLEMKSCELQLSDFYKKILMNRVEKDDKSIFRMLDETYI